MSYVLWLRHLSPSLHYGWTKRGYLLSTSSAHRIAFSFEAMGTGIFHWMLGVPLGRGRVSTAITPVGVVLSLLAAAVLVAIVVPPLVGVVRRRGREPGPLLASSLAVVLAVVLALAGRSPFGGGRTDEVLYPSILLLAAGAVTPLVTRAGARTRAPRSPAWSSSPPSWWASGRPTARRTRRRTSARWPSSSTRRQRAPAAASSWSTRGSPSPGPTTA